MVYAVGMPNQDLRFTMRAELFNDFSKALAAFNKRTDKVNKELKKKKYERVNRFPVDHRTTIVGSTVTVCLGIKDRAKVLFQELCQIVTKFEICAQPAVLKIQPLVKPVSKPVAARSAPQWGLWVPCADEATARAAAGFLQAVAKVGVPQVECRG